MNFQDWLCNKIKIDIQSVFGHDNLLMLEAKYQEEKAKYSEKKNHNYIWELLCVHLDPITILKCGEVCWEWYRWSRANITWLSKKNKLVKNFPELLSLIDKDYNENNHNTRMIKIFKRDVPKYSPDGCSIFIPPKGIYRLYTRYLLPLINHKKKCLNLKKIKGTTFVPILMSIYRLSDYSKFDKIISISSNYKEKTISVTHEKSTSELYLNTDEFSYTEDFVQFILNIY